MATLRQVLRKIFLLDFREGMGVTLSHLSKKPVTLQYPKEKPVIRPRFRGVFKLLIDENGREICNGCKMCEVACPVECITMDRVGKGKNTWAETFDIDITHCMFCNLCVEACPSDCIIMTETYETSGYDRNIIMSKNELYADIDGLRFTK